MYIGIILKNGSFHGLVRIDESDDNCAKRKLYDHEQKLESENDGIFRAMLVDTDEIRTI